MVLEKEAAAVANTAADGAAQKRKPVKCPQKTGINLAMRDKNPAAVRTAILGVAIILALVALVAKFGVYDQYAQLREAEAAYQETHRLAQSAQALVADYPAVLREYHTYSMAWMHSGEAEALVRVDRQEILDLIESELMTRGRVQSLEISEGMVYAEMSGMNLEQISRMFSALTEQPLVSKVELNLAASEEKTDASVLQFSLTILLAERTEEAAT